MQLYLRLFASSIRARMQYKWDFVITTVAYAMMSAVDFVTVAAILFRYHTVAGWDVYQVALLSGVASTSSGLMRVFTGDLYYFERYLLTGEFDSLLIRPWPTLASLFVRNVELGRVGAVLQGALIMGIGLHGVMAQGAPAWLPFYVCLLPIAGGITVTSIGLVTATCGFWLIRIGDLYTFTMNAPTTAASYPADILPGWLRYLLTFLLPVVGMGYTPLRYGLHKGGTVFSLMVPFVTAAVALSAALLFWRFGERRYQSTGS
jgi:ABC-2 type transport system permease protein